MIRTLEDVEAVLKNSRDFYEAHGLSEWAEALQVSPQLDEGSLQRLGEAHDFIHALAFPSPTVQSTTFPRLAEVMLASPIEEVPPEHHYSTPGFAMMEEMRAIPMRNRPDGPYLLLYMDGPFPEETRGKKVPELDGLFAAKGWNGLTVPEYLVLQRDSLLRHKDHRFDDYVNSPSGPQWSWLLDSHAPAHCVAAYWNPGKRHVEIYSCKQGSKNDRRGAHPTIVVALE